MPDKPNLLKMVSQHSDLSLMYEQIAKVFMAHEQYDSAKYRAEISLIHKHTSDVLYRLRMFIANDLLADPSIESYVGNQIRQLLKDRGLLELL